MSTRFRIGHASYPDWPVAADQALGPVLAPPDPPADGGRSARLGLCFLTPSQARTLPPVIAHLRRRTGIEHWVGAIYPGVCVGETEYHDEPAIAVMTLTLPAGSFRLFGGAGEGTRLPLDDGFDAAHALVHGPPDASAADDIRRLADRLDVDRLFGGLTAETPAATGATLTAGRGARRARATVAPLSGVLFDPRVPLLSRVTQGCAPLAHPHVISACKSNYIHALDGEPALDVMLRDLGVDEAARGSRDGEALLRALPRERLRNGLLVGLAPAAARGPATGGGRLSDRLWGAHAGDEAGVQVGPRGGHHPGGPGGGARDMGEYLVRALVGIDPRNRMLAIGARPEPGERIIFCTRDRASARADLIRICTELREEVESEGLTIRGALYHSCVARGRYLFGATGDEMAIIRHNLGAIPIIGMYGNGEIAGDRLYSHTGVLTLFT